MGMDGPRLCMATAMECKIGRRSVAWFDLWSTKEEEGIQLLLHGDGRWYAKSEGSVAI